MEGEALTLEGADLIDIPLRRWLDSYLNSRCSCHPGFDCGTHNDIRREVASEVYEISMREFNRNVIFVAK